MMTLVDSDSEHADSLNTIEEAIQDLRAGKMIILLDREDRENEGDLIIAAQFATAEAINMMITEARGLICAPLTPERIEELELPIMVSRNTESHKTAFTVSCDLIPGCTTGISASDRSKTLLALADLDTKPEDFARPGHIFPLRARKGGVLVRTGQTEGSIDLCKLAGLKPATAICEILNADGSMARMDDLKEFAENHELKLITVPQIIDYRRRFETLVTEESSYEVETEYGPFILKEFSNILDDNPAFALVVGNLQEENRTPLVRVQVENMLSDNLGIISGKAPGGSQLALKMIARYGTGVLVVLLDDNRKSHLKHELDKLHSTRSAQGTVGSKDPLQAIRNIGLGSQILRSLGIGKMKLISNHPMQVYAGLEAFHLEITEQISFDSN